MRIYTRIPVGLTVGCIALLVASVSFQLHAAQVIAVSDFQDNSADGWQVDRLAQHVAPKLIENGEAVQQPAAFLQPLVQAQ